MTSSELESGAAFPVALRTAIEASGLTLDRLRYRLAQRGIQVSVTSLSYWQQGRSRPERADSLRAVRAIESILGLPSHSLAALLGPPRPRGRWLGREEREYDGILEPATALAETIKPVLGQSDRKLRVFSQDDAVTVGEDRSIHTVRTRMVVRALADDPDRHLAVYCGEPGSTPADLVVHALSNCRLGRVRRHPRVPVIAAELMFDRRLRAGETHLLEYEVAVDASPPSPDYRRGFRYPADAYVVSVRFADSALPARIYGFSQPEPHVVPQLDGEMIITAGRWVHRAARDVRPGVLGIGWEWN